MSRIVKELDSAINENKLKKMNKNENLNIARMQQISSKKIKESNGNTKSRTTDNYSEVTSSLKKDERFQRNSQTHSV